MTLAHWPMYALALAALVWIVWSERRRAADAERKSRALRAAQKGLRP